MRVEGAEKNCKETSELVAGGEHTGRNDRILALDVGVRRIGMAVSDELGWTAVGLPTLARTRVREDVAAVARVAAETGARHLLLGLPFHMDGTEGTQAAYVRDFGERLVKRAGLAVEYWDERLTSVEAAGILAAQSAGRRRDKGDLDRVSAALLLQEYLDARRAEQA
ncbi:MAG: Holliday junction resolvase RuvX [Bryobacterales bacterium]|nr:Holliday junction resolvase RuvX [Bryobacterales bacterium]